jgi:hypothetical protein
MNNFELNYHCVLEKVPVTGDIVVNKTNQILVLQGKFSNRNTDLLSQYESTLNYVL